MRVIAGGDRHRCDRARGTRLLEACLQPLRTEVERVGHLGEVDRLPERRRVDPGLRDETPFAHGALDELEASRGGLLAAEDEPGCERRQQHPLANRLAGQLRIDSCNNLALVSWNSLVLPGEREPRRLELQLELAILSTELLQRLLYELERVERAMAVAQGRGEQHRRACPRDGRVG